jgi:dolichol-phosphate mannosyltransferase
VKVVLAIPAYNCGNQLKRVLAAIDPQLANRFSDILVIDNISPDDTAEVALSFKKKLKNLHVLRNSQNYSLGGSHKVAFLYGETVGATHVAILHGDDQAVPSELHELLDIAKARPKVDAILGSRFMKASRLEGYDRKRIAGNRVLNAMYTLLTGRRCRDLGSGLNVFKLSTLKDHTYLDFADQLTFNFELLLFLIDRRADFIYHPITWRESDQVSNARNFNIAKTALLNVIKWRFNLLRYYKARRPEDYQSKEL